MARKSKTAAAGTGAGQPPAPGAGAGPANAAPPAGPRILVLGPAVTISTAESLRVELLGLVEGGGDVCIDASAVEVDTAGMQVLVAFRRALRNANRSLTWAGPRTIGVYSVLAYAVARQTHDLGIRMAIGAARGDVLRLVMGMGLRLLAVGLGVGLILSLALSRAIQSQLWGVSPSDPLTVAGVVVLLLGTGLLACWVPADRATRVDPVVALRCE